MKQEIKTFEIVMVEGPEIEVFSATPMQAQLYWECKYDHQATFYRTIQPLNLSSTVFKGNQDYCSAIDPVTNNVLFTFCQDPKTGVFYRLDNEDEPAEPIDYKYLEAFPNFNELVECSICEGSGTAEGAAMDCGTRFYAEACNCESVIFEK
jgi:hypothetical protein